MLLNHAVLSYYGLLDDPLSAANSVHVLCQYHDDTKPSMHVSQYVFQCWSCGAKGTIEQLIQHLEYTQTGNELDGWQVLLKIAEIKKAYKNIEILEEKRSNVDYRAAEYVVSPQEAKLLSKLFLEILGSPVWQKLDDHLLIQRKYTPYTLQYFDVKINTVGLWPIVLPLSWQGEHIGHVSRAIADDIEPKYLYNAGFKKSHHIGGFLKKGPVIVVEGWLDMMKAHQYGYKNVVCIFGCDCSEIQKDLILQYATEIIDALDNDQAGRKGSEKLRKMCSAVPYTRLQYKSKDIGEASERELFEAFTMLSLPKMLRIA